jgi:hypothetical protein
LSWKFLPQPKGVLYGQVVDAWQSTIAGVGPVGEDKGAGGKYLFLPIVGDAPGSLERLTVKEPQGCQTDRDATR